ncbi:hypothetical protein [Nocardioides alkalitolerans]|nr:hypothetical protein [Nocardioides alkalitolerans]
MSAEYVRRTYGVPYKGEKHTERCHPKWRVEPVKAKSGAVQ